MHVCRYLLIMESRTTMQLKDKIRERLIETIEGVDQTMLMRTMVGMGSIPTAKHLSLEVIQNNLGGLTYSIGDKVDLEIDLKDKVRAKIRFAEYIDRLRDEPAAPRGYACEGMMAGIFGGETEEIESSKTDITIKGKPYQVKSAEMRYSWDSGSLDTDYKNAINEMERNGVQNEFYEEIGEVNRKFFKGVSPEHLARASSRWNDYKKTMYNSVRMVDWLFIHLSKTSNIVKYWEVKGEELVNLLIEPTSNVITAGRSRDTDIRFGVAPIIKIASNEGTITFPTITNEDLLTQIYKGEEDTSTGSKVRRILNPAKPYKVNQATVNYITDLVKDGNIDTLINGLNSIKDELGGVDKLEEKINEFKILTEGIRDSHIFTQKLPVRIDNELYILSNKLGGLEHRDIVNFGEKATKHDIHVVGRLLDMFPSTLQDLINYVGNFDELRNSKEYQRIINFIKVGALNESDVFGQGLLDPIEPEEFEGEDEEWEKLMSDVEDEPADEPTYDYQGGKTDPEKGFVAPSSEVTDNICSVEGICDAQGPITFGQLKALVEEATKKRIAGDMGRGVFKTLWRIIPFFIPQVLLAAVGITVTRAINKIVTPALKDTRGYKSWWGKAVLKAMDVAEGDYIPDVAIGDDPLSKIFFISDGLFQMIRDKYKLKFARYVSDIASSKPDDEVVPDWFVDNLLRDYLNQKFLLNPPLQLRNGVIGDDSNIQETINTWLDQDYDVVLGETILFKDKSSKCVLKGQEIIEKINETFSNGTDSYLKYISTKDLTLLSEAESYETFSFRRLHKDGINDTTLNVPSATLINYLDRHHREGLESLLGKILPVIKQEYFEGKVFTSRCRGMVNLFDKEVLKIENNLYKFGFLKNAISNTVDGVSIFAYLPYSYNNWLENIIKDIDKDFYIKYNDELAWLDITGDVDDLMEEKKHNKFKENLEVGDLIELLALDDPYTDIPLRTRGIVLEIEKTPWGRKYNVRWMIGNQPYGWRTFSLLPESGDLWRKVGYETISSEILDRWSAEKIIDAETGNHDGYQYADNPVNEEIIGQMGNTSLVRAYYDVKGGWGTPPKRFTILMMPSGKVIDINLSQYTTSRDVPFKLGDILSLNKLIKFENESKFELRVKGRFSESTLNEGVTKFDMEKMTPRLWKLVKSIIKVSKLNRELEFPGKVDLNDVFNVGGTYSVRHVKDMGTYFVEHVKKYSGLATYEAAILYLIIVHNIHEYPEKDILDLSWEDVKLPTLYDNELEYYERFDEFEDQEPCTDDGYGEHSGDDCDCEDWEEVVIEDKDGNEERISCDELDYEQLDSLDMTEDDCECEEWRDNYFTKYYYPKTVIEFYSIGETYLKEDEDFNLTNKPFYIYESDSNHDDEYDEWYTEDEFYGEVADREDKITWIQESEEPPSWYMPHINKQFYAKTNRLFEEKESKQTTLFPLGEWVFPSDMPDEEREDIDGKIHKSMIRYIFKKWSQGDFDMSKFRHIGISSVDTELVVELLKRWIHTVNDAPIPVKTTYNCDRLIDMFNSDAEGYDHVKEYLCDGMIDRDFDFYGTEYDDNLYYMVNEVNKKYIAEILGVPQGSVDNILSKSAQDESTQNYIDENESLINDVVGVIADAYDLEYEDATYRDIENGIDAALASHFEHMGRMVRGEQGDITWVIEDDLRNVLTYDMWEDESTLEFLRDTVGGLTLDEFMKDTSLSHTNPTTIFDVLMDAEYKFEDYGTGKKGDMLENESSAYHSYYYANVESKWFNHILDDRLANLDWDIKEFKDKSVETIQEQSTDSPGDYISDESPQGFFAIDNKPFTKMETKVMNRLFRTMDMNDIEKVANDNYYDIHGRIWEKYWQTIKLYGMAGDENDAFKHERSQKFAKWMVDNVADARIDGGGNETTVDFNNVMSPVKERMKVYDVKMEESGWEKVYRAGTTEIPAWNEDEAEEISDQFFYEYNGETEWVDGGGYDVDSTESTTQKFVRMLEQKKKMKVGLIAESIFDDIKSLSRISKNTSTKNLGDYYSRGDVMKFLDHLQNSGLVNMQPLYLYQSVDFLWSGKDWLRKYLDLNHPELLISVQDGCVEEPGWNDDGYGNAENNADMRCDDVKYLFDNADKVRDVIIILSITKLERESSSLEGTAVERQLRPISQDMVTLWMSLKS
jgi:hypothetical protein